MKKYSVYILLFFVIGALSAQSVFGDWQGVLNVQGSKLRIVFHIEKTDVGFSSTMDSPDQSAKDIPMNSTRFENSVLTIKMDAANIEYTGTFMTDSIKGTFKQAGMSFPLNLSRHIDKPKIISRSQEPTKPYPYYSEEVTFENKKDNVKLAGTLTIPKKSGKFPVVVLISGSGPQNRDEELMGHKPFLVLSDYLTRNGIAVLRYDDRGSYKSNGDFSIATTFDFANDALAAVNYLKSRKDINSKKIGLIGHSEGGIIAPIVATKSNSVNFIVLMAGTAVSGSDLLLKQQEDIARVSGMEENDLQKMLRTNKSVYKLVYKIQNKDTLKAKLTEIIKENSKLDNKIIDLQVNQTLSPWMLNFIQYNPALILEKVKCPVLAINGTKDLQVSSKINLAIIAERLKKGGNKKVSIKEFEGLNHLFQECNTGLPNEYSEIDQTISPVVLNEIKNWIVQTVK